jgi:hypothetical protein
MWANMQKGGITLPMFTSLDERHFQHYFSYIVAVSFIGGLVEETGVSRENLQPAASH